MLQKLGFGVGLRPAHYPDFHARNTPKIDWLELISENFMGIGGRPRRHIERIRADYPMAAHGIGLGIAGIDPLNEHYLKLLKDLIHWLQPSLVTDHLCWTSWRGQKSYDLLPFPLNDESLNHVASRVERVQDILQVPLLLENPSAYIDFRASDRHEPDFLNELCARTGCGILLDLNNCMVNSKNLGWDPEDYIHRLKPEHVGQFHLAGHAVHPEICIDTHDQPVPDEVWQLYRRAVQLFPGVPSLIEWDGKLPALERLGEELAAARQHAAEAASERKAAAPELGVVGGERRSGATANLATHQEKLFAVLRCEAPDTVLTPLLLEPHAKPEHGLRAYANNHFSAMLDALTNTFSTLHGIVEDKAMAEIVAQFLRSIPPEHFSINFAGSLLPNFLREQSVGIDFGVPQALIAELAAFDAAHLELAMQPNASIPAFGVELLMQWTPEQWESARFILRHEHRLLHLEWDILSVYTGLQAGEIPPPPDRASAPILMTREDDGLLFDYCPEAIQKLLGVRGESFGLGDLVALFENPDTSSEEATSLALDALLAAVHRAMIGLQSQA